MASVSKPGTKQAQATSQGESAYNPTRPTHWRSVQGKQLWVVAMVQHARKASMDDASATWRIVKGRSSSELTQRSGRQARAT